MNVMKILSFCILLWHLVYAQNLYGANVYWRPTSNQSVVLSYRLIWEGQDSIESVKHQCKDRPPFITAEECKNKIQSNFIAGKFQVHDARIIKRIFDGYTWQCIQGCYINNRAISNLSQLYFTESSRFYSTVWESGVESVEITFNNKDDTDNLRFGFTYPNGTLVDGLAEAFLSMAVRNDTNRPNISPLVNVFPVYRVPIGCSLIIRLFPFDGDGDMVRCHWQKRPNNDSPGAFAVLNSHTCEINVTASTNFFNPGDVFYFSLFAEDYSDTLVELAGVTKYITSGPFCRTPIKIRISIGNATSSCNTVGPLFIKDGTFPPYFKSSYKEGNLTTGIDTFIPLKTSDEKDTILTSGPRYMTFTTEKNESVIAYGKWTDLNDKTMKGIHQVCGMAYSEDGTPGESRCAVLLIFEPNECQELSNPCREDGICDNFFEHFTCSYPIIKSTENQSQNGICQPGATHVSDSKYLVKIGLPVGLFLLLLLILIAVTLYLKHKWSEKMQTVNVGDETQISALK